MNKFINIKLIMKSYKLLLCLLLILSYGCTANLIKDNVTVNKTNEIVNSQLDCYISNLQILSKNNPGDYSRDKNSLNNFKESLANSIYNTNLFKSVKYLDPEIKKIEGDPVFLNISIIAEEIGGFNWCISWCAIYPMPLYMPLQMKKGTVIVTIDTEVRKKHTILTTIKSTSEVPYDIYFYGFFRTSPIEDAAANACYIAFANLQKDLIINEQKIKYGANEKLNIDTLAILPLEANNVSKQNSAIITDKLRASITKMNKFTVLDRTIMNRILTEQEFQLSGCTSDTCQIQVGKLLSVKHILTGSVGKIGNLFYISIRIVNVETGRVERHIEKQYKGSIDIIMTKGIDELLLELN